MGGLALRLYNLNDPTELVSFEEATRRGLGRSRGLFFPCELSPMPALDSLWELSFAERSARLLSHLIGDELSLEQLRLMASRAFSAPAPLKQVSSDRYALELFHGPTLAFKDYGARFMAECLSVFGRGERCTILTATSGDTGAAVAHAFYGAPMIDVVILYPQGQISPEQEALFCTLGGNISTLAVEADFDACQALVKACFDDEALRDAHRLNSANSINISRLLAQVCYYFEAAAQRPASLRSQLCYSVPSGNFGDLTAGLIARALGLPSAGLIAATNSNDTVPRYLLEGTWSPQPTRATLSNAMDVSAPSNWPRIEALFRQQGWALHELMSCSISEEETRAALRELHTLGYLCEPHGAVAWAALKRAQARGDVGEGVFLCTAHPAKFKAVIDELLSCELNLPEPLALHLNRPLLSERIPASLERVQAHLRERSARW